MKTVAFRADGGQNVGMGHVMRCLSLAKEFRRNGYKVYFISKLTEGIKKIEEAGFEVIKLTSKGKISSKEFYYGDIKELKKEAEEMIDFNKKYNIEILFIDTYNVTKEYFLSIKPYVTKLAYIDDVNKFVYPVDILINGNITGEYMDYKKYSEDEIMLLGPKYNLIRDEFRNLPEREINKEVKEIMITTGGSDPHNMSTKLLYMLLEDNKIGKLRFNVIVGNGFINKEELSKISKQNKNVVLYENVKRISEIMLRSDIAISSGGSTLYELCACGTPTMAFILADNQEFIVEKMDEYGYVKSLEWYNKIDKDIFLSKLKSLVFDYNLRQVISQKGQKLLDGNGASRVVKKVSKS
ncbi:UDP-2,4-diacetamido-2,4,6-trideoxy-beta-L-altropyranose hydrolase [Crassaminicella indica]|uniref:UDP-2,4-diacetamido-2,4, 6-trideoxy-beta-L-altropyranose hydrolase n=1 Tax=Crassaminicella indica TaxID=2855394 RepID=A0ABX8RA93_9CLOT|nr:UDP-2,4-diacetamido-2,4,6-trideoxy-beta-L-altropyranose hydrolase [Crassaminicella indica]QXM05182.1 UDP-2,4-diacetamido-2,4,6-trideoxy-beta-L-altropyranose hydrolase [Crassaminicella indica]